MELSRLLAVERGITALIGSGGKTTAMYLLAQELSQKGTVICTTSTHILIPDHLPVLVEPEAEKLAAALERVPVICTGGAGPEGKLCSSALSWDTLVALADYVLVEADGSHCLPCKAHLPYEPVIPPGTGQAILLVGATGFGKPVGQAAHRPEEFCRLSGLGMADPITPEAVAAVIREENLGDKVLINQVDQPDTLEQARETACGLNMPVFAGSLWKRSILCLS